MRQPLNVVGFVHRGEVPAVEYALFQRSDDATWQPVTGGVEGDESLEQAIAREVAEETGLAELATQPLT